MAEWIEGVKCIHSIGCGIMISLLLSLAIRAHINYSSNSCDESGTHLEGNSKCEMTTARIWSLSIFYSGAIIFAIGSLATCFSNGYMVIFYMICVGGWMGTIGGLTIYRMTSEKVIFFDAFESIYSEMILSKWDIWATITQWALVITLGVTLVSALVMLLYFLNYKQV